MVRKVVTMVLIGGSMVLAACNTVRGAANDVESVGDCVDGRAGNC